jgi:RHS repeat-associated protein
VDKSEDIEEIVWRVDSKIAEVRRTNNSTKKNLRFDYDAMGNRIAKHIYTDNQFTAVEKSTYYVRDASGNVMAVYDRIINETEETGGFALSERHIYGSSRIGMDVTTYDFISTTYTATNETTRELGHKQYEISNHLGNVLSVITDQKLPIEDAGVIVSYSAVVITATDYSPFGVGLYGRSWSEGYRYGFNGKEIDSEGMGGGLSTYDYGFRIYNSQLAKFLSTDPLHKEYPFYSPYHFGGNNPIKFIDRDGLEPATKGEFDGEIRVAHLQDNVSLENQLYYWVWIEQEVVIPYSRHSDWVNISVRPIEIVEHVQSDPIWVPIIIQGTAAETEWIDARMRSDVVENPAIASTGGASGVNGGRFGCTRYGTSSSCPPGRRYHDGTDIFADPGTPMMAIFGGNVVATQFGYDPGAQGDNGYGNFIEIETVIEGGQTLRIKYAHLDGVGVKIGDHVSSGEVIGTAGATGNAYNVPNPHIHVRARLNGNNAGDSVDPEDYMPTQFNEDGQPEE